MYNFDNEIDKLKEEIHKLKRTISRLEEEKKEVLNSAITVFEEEKIRILSSLAKSQKSIFAKSIENTDTIVELAIHEVSGKYIKCYERQTRREFSLEEIGRRIAFTMDDFEHIKSDVLNLKKSTSDYKLLSVLPSVDQEHWPPKDLGGLHHF